LHLLKSRTSLEISIAFKLHLSISRTSLEAYIDFKFDLSISIITSLEAYFGGFTE